MVNELYLLVITVLLLFALALTIPVVVDILREGVQHEGAWRFADQDEDAVGSDTPTTSDTDTPDTRPCPNCGATNDGNYRYCEQCATRL
jgi:hypothetical protein